MYVNHQIIQTPTFLEKNDQLMYFKRLNIHIRNYYSNIQTPTPCGRFWTSTRVLQSFSEYPLDSYCHCGARTGVAKCVLTFNSLCGARTGVAKHVLAFDSFCRTRMGVAKHVIAFDSLCEAQTGVSILGCNIWWLLMCYTCISCSSLHSNYVHVSVEADVCWEV